MPPTADAAKAFNKQLRATAEALGGLRGTAAGHRYGFACECGCGATTRLTLEEYDEQDGAWFDEGHKPPQK
jgi:hypothetical protein